jgi:glyoxylase-like metal-dependent hydrolase (beta-lactamase superfamily II)
LPEQPDFNWFEVRTFEHDIIGIGEPGHFEDVKSYLAIGNDLAMLVDSGMGFANLRAVVEHYTDLSVLLINSHGHLDHIGDNWRFERRWAHAAEADRIRDGVANERMRHFLADDALSRPTPAGLDRDSFSIPGTELERTVDEGDVVDLGGRQFAILHTPGHSAGSISFFEEATGILIAGDIVYEGPLFAHHPDASAVDYRESLRKLNELAPKISTVYPAHNRYPLPPAFITEIHQAIEEIFNGREPDKHEDGREFFDFGHFSYSFLENWREEEGA